MTGAKDYIRMIAVTAVALLLIPLVGYAGKRSTAATSAEDKTPDEGVSILMRESGEVVTLSERDYVIGAVFAQMPADFEPEALKAQAVLAYTYAERRRLSERTAPTAELKGAVMSDDTSLYQAYFTEEQAKALYGEDYETARKRIAEAAEHFPGILPVQAGFMQAFDQQLLHILQVHVQPEAQKKHRLPAHRLL